MTSVRAYTKEERKLRKRSCCWESLTEIVLFALCERLESREAKLND